MTSRIWTKQFRLLPPAGIRAGRVRPSEPRCIYGATDPRIDRQSRRRRARGSGAAGPAGCRARRTFDGRDGLARVCAAALAGGRGAGSWDGADLHCRQGRLRPASVRAAHGRAVHRRLRALRYVVTQGLVHHGRPIDVRSRSRPESGGAGARAARVGERRRGRGECARGGGVQRLGPLVGDHGACARRGWHRRLADHTARRAPSRPRPGERAAGADRWRGPHGAARAGRTIGRPHVGLRAANSGWRPVSPHDHGCRGDSRRPLDRRVHRRHSGAAAAGNGGFGRGPGRGTGNPRARAP